MSRKINVVLVGASGRMGQEISLLLNKSASAKLLREVSRSKPGKNDGLSGIRSTVVDVVIDFSTNKNFLKTVSWCEKNRVPLVSGITGLSKKQTLALKRAGKKIPVLWSANMSIGINIFLHLIECLAPFFLNYDLQLEEFHHNKKVDAPSGTAIVLQNALTHASKKKMPRVLSVRGGGIFGIHKLWMMGEEETLIIEHSALNRKVFARGAVMAAEWIVGKKPGLYAMKDLWKTKTR